MEHSIDLTTIYSAQAALESASLMDCNHAWFTYSLLQLTAALTNGPVVWVAKPMKSREEDWKAYGTIPKALSRVSTHRLEFVEYEKQYIDDCREKKAEWLDANKEELCSLSELSSLWNQPQFVNWLQWHKAFEWESHERRLGGLIEEDIRLLLAEQGITDEDRMYVVDVIARGYYYWELYSGNIWLHPIRLANTPGLPKPSDFPNDVSFGGDLMSLAFGALQRQFDNKGIEPRMEYWANLVKSMSRCREMFQTEEAACNELAKELKIAKWTNLVEEVKDWLPPLVGLCVAALYLLNVPIPTAPIGGVTSLVLLSGSRIKHQEKKALNETKDLGSRIICIAKGGV